MFVGNELMELFDIHRTKMAFQGPYWLNLFWNSQYVVVDGTVRTYENEPDASIPIKKRLSYSEIMDMICGVAG